MSPLPSPWSDFEPRAGALRYTDTDGVEHYANPGDPLFSTVTMLATEFWSEGAGWQRIHVEASDESRYVGSAFGPITKQLLGRK